MNPDPNSPLRARYGSLVTSLQAAIDAGDEAAFRGAFDQLREGLSAELKRNKLAFEVKAKPLRQLRVSGHQAQVQDFNVGKFPGSARAVPRSCAVWNSRSSAS